MTNEARQSKRAALRILELMKEGRPHAVIVWRIMTEYGYGELFVNRVIKAYENNQAALEGMTYEDNNNN